MALVQGLIEMSIYNQGEQQCISRISNQPDPVKYRLNIGNNLIIYKMKDELFTINATVTTVASTKNTPQNVHDVNITGRRFHLAITNGLIQTTKNLMNPNAKLAHLALVVVIPADSNIITE